MTMIDRYECGEERLVMDLSPQGEWVMYEDAAARIAELEAALAPFAAMIRPNTFDPKGIARFGVSGRAGNDDYRAAYAALNIANDKGE
jgi:hypothetical protein